MGIPKKHKSKVLIANILLLLGIIFSGIGIFASVFLTTSFTSPAFLNQIKNLSAEKQIVATHIYGGFFPAFLSVMIIVSVVGIILALLALWFSSWKEDVEKAAILALISAFVPPLGILQLIAAILLFISRK